MSSYKGLQRLLNGALLYKIDVPLGRQTKSNQSCRRPCTSIANCRMRLRRKMEVAGLWNGHIADLHLTARPNERNKWPHRWINLCLKPIKVSTGWNYPNNRSIWSEICEIQSTAALIPTSIRSIRGRSHWHRKYCPNMSDEDVISLLNCECIKSIDHQFFLERHNNQYLATAARAYQLDQLGQLGSSLADIETEVPKPERWTLEIYCMG